MKFLSAALQGSVVFLTLLISQVIIVTSLALTALWLYFKRLQRGAEEGEHDNEGSSSGVSNEFLRELQQKLVTLEKDKAEYLQSDSVQALNVEKAKTEELQKAHQGTLEKVQVLETKLLEYEVLKEEIALITQYKSENQKLKLEIEALQKQTVDNTGKKNLENELPSEPVKTSPEPEKTVPTSNVENVVPEATVLTDPGLEGLLNEIEALTADKKNDLKKAS